MTSSIVFIVLGGLAAIVTLQILIPAKDNSQTIAIIIGLLSMAVGQIANLNKTQENKDVIKAQGEQHSIEIQKVASAVDGRVAQLVDSSAKAATMVERAARVSDEIAGLKADLASNTELTRQLATRADNAEVASALAATVSKTS